MLKIYSKLSLSGLVNEVSKNIQKIDDTEDYEKLGSIRFAHYTDYFLDKDLESLNNQYKRFYELNFNDSKNKVVDCFKRRDFEKIT